MVSKEDVERTLQGISDLNTEMGAWAIIIPLVFVVLVISLLLYCYWKPGKKSSRALIGSLAVIYVYSGFTILSGINEMGAASAWVGAVALWAVAFFLVLDMIFYWTEIRLPERLDLKVISITLMATGIFIYPLLEIALGFTWPRMVLFGAECPTTIFLIGLFIGSIPKVNKPLIVIASLNALAVGLSFALNGAPFDFLYAAAGVIGILMIIKDFRIIFRKSPVNTVGRDQAALKMQI